MYRRVLVPLDGSSIAEAVLPFVERIAGPLDLETVLVRVVSLTPEEVIGVARKYAQDSPGAREWEAQQYLEPLAAELEGRGIRARARVALGEPASEIVAVARQVEADLIAMTTHGRSGLGRLLFGSVAEAVLGAAPVPVFLLKMTEAALAAGPAGRAPLPVGRVLFATDFSDTGGAAWPTARRLAAAFEAELILQHVVAPSRSPGEARAEAGRELGRLRTDAGGLKARTRVDEGRPADRVLRAAEEEAVDLIVMGTVGKTGVRRLLLGSVAAEVVRLAPCPVVTVGPVAQKATGVHVP